MNAFFAAGAYFNGAPVPVAEAAHRQSLRFQLQPAQEGAAPAWAGESLKDGELTPLARRAFPRIEAEGAVFAGDADFSNRAVLQPSSFVNARFDGFARFHGSRLHPGLRFFSTRFDDALNGGDFLPAVPEAHWEQLLRAENRALELKDEPALELEVFKRLFDERRKKAAAERREQSLKQLHTSARSADPSRTPEDFDKWRKSQAGRAALANDRFEQLEGCYRVLKLAMEQVRDGVEAGGFFRLELLARRKRRDKAVPWWERAASFWYALLADYGNSIARPLGWLFLVVLPFSTGLYWLLASLSDGAHGLAARLALSLERPIDPELFHAIEFALARLLPIDVNGNEATFLEGLGAGWRFLFVVLGTGQAVISLTLVFLSALAVRRRFQIS